MVLAIVLSCSFPKRSYCLRTSFAIILPAFKNRIILCDILELLLCSIWCKCFSLLLIHFCFTAIKNFMLISQIGHSSFVNHLLQMVIPSTPNQWIILEFCCCLFFVVVCLFCVCVCVLSVSNMQLGTREPFSDADTHVNSNKESGCWGYQLGCL